MQSGSFLHILSYFLAPVASHWWEMTRLDVPARVIPRPPNATLITHSVTHPFLGTGQIVVEMHRAVLGSGRTVFCKETR